MTPDSLTIQLEPRECPLCGGHDYHLLFSDVNRREALPVSCNLVECNACTMRYLNPAPDSFSLRRLYGEGLVDPVDAGESLASTSSGELAGGRLRPILRWLNGKLRGHPRDWPEGSGDGRSVLDFGCLSGDKLRSFHQRGWRIAGIDLNQRAIEAARRRFPEGQFWCGDVLEMEIAERFDLVRADSVVEHLLQPLPYLAALAHLLKPEGRLCVFVPNSGSLSVRLFGRYSYACWMPFHVNLFNRRTMKAALEKAGLGSVECRTFSPIGSWTHTQRQLLLAPGFDRRPPQRLDRMLRRLSLWNYPGETLAQWAGLGEEIFATGRNA